MHSFVMYGYGYTADRGLATGSTSTCSSIDFMIDIGIMSTLYGLHGWCLDTWRKFDRDSLSLKLRENIHLFI